MSHVQAKLSRQQRRAKERKEHKEAARLARELPSQADHQTACPLEDERYERALKLELERIRERQRKTDLGACRCRRSRADVGNPFVDELVAMADNCPPVYDFPDRAVYLPVWEGSCMETSAKNNARAKEIGRAIFERGQAYGGVGNLELRRAFALVEREIKCRAYHAECWHMIGDLNELNYAWNGIGDWLA